MKKIVQICYMTCEGGRPYNGGRGCVRVDGEVVAEDAEALGVCDVGTHDLPAVRVEISARTVPLYLRFFDDVT